MVTPLYLTAYGTAHGEEDNENHGVVTQSLAVTAEPSFFTREEANFGTIFLIKFKTNLNKPAVENILPSFDILLRF